MSKPKILIIENAIAVTGALKAILNSAHLLRHRYEFQFVLPSNSAAREKVESFGFTVAAEWRMVEIRKSLKDLLRYIPFLVRNSVNLRRLVKRNGIELIHVNDLYNLIVPVAHMTGLKIPYIVHVRFLPARFPKMLFSFWVKVHLRYAEKLIVVSDAVKHSLPYHSKIDRVYDTLVSTEAKSVQSENGQRNIFLYLANFIPGKGQNFALAAFIKIHRHIDSWRIRFVGGDMGLEKNRLFSAQLKLIAETAGIEKKIDWIGFTDDVEREYMAADIALNFSESESFSMTCAEALYFGVPVIASRSGGPAEIVDDGETGLLVENKNIQQMADAMLALAQDASVRKKMKEKSGKAMRRKFGAEKTSALLAQVYDTCLRK